jgi:hypothetical protein
MIARLLWPVWSMIARSKTPAAVAAVANPARRLCPQAMRRVEAGLGRRTLDDAGDVTHIEAARLHTPEAQRAEQWPILNIYAHSSQAWSWRTEQVSELER